MIEVVGFIIAAGVPAAGWILSERRRIREVAICDAAAADAHLRYLRAEHSRRKCHEMELQLLREQIERLNPEFHWIVGEYRGGKIGRIAWELVGIFRSHEEAEAACTTKLHFIAPVRLGEILPDKSEAGQIVYPLQRKAS